MTAATKEIMTMLDMLPEDEQKFACEVMKKLFLAWDPDFTKLTPEEAERLKTAEESGFIFEHDIDWDNIGI